MLQWTSKHTFIVLFLFLQALLVVCAIVLVSAAPAHDETIVNDVANDEGK
jgi:hypothetical protein